MKNRCMEWICHTRFLPGGNWCCCVGSADSPWLNIYHLNLCYSVGGVNTFGWLVAPVWHSTCHDTHWQPNVRQSFTAQPHVYMVKASGCFKQSGRTEAETCNPTCPLHMLMSRREQQHCLHASIVFIWPIFVEILCSKWLQIMQGPWKLLVWGVVERA